MKRILRLLLLLPNPRFLRFSQRAGSLTRNRKHLDLSTLSHTERMEASPMSEVEREKKSLPLLSQSRYSDMACETLYVHKHVHCAKLGESEPAARGTEVGPSSCGVFTSRL
jgi:hypothetical protein